MDDEKHYAQMGRMMHNFVIWGGASSLVCVVLTSILGEASRYSNWVLAVSLLGGAGIAYWLWKARKKEEAALQSTKDVVESAK